QPAGARERPRVDDPRDLGDGARAGRDAGPARRIARLARGADCADRLRLSPTKQFQSHGNRPGTSLPPPRERDPMQRVTPDPVRPTGTRHRPAAGFCLSTLMMLACTPYGAE